MNQSGAFKVSKEGYVLLQFAPASGVRQYDWSRKQVYLALALFVILMHKYSIICIVVYVIGGLI